MRLLVTGGAGFIGSHFIRQIIDRPEIEKLVNVDCLTYAGSVNNLQGIDRHPKYTFEQLDLRVKASVVTVIREHAISHVLHLAAESHVDRSIESPGEFVHTNVLGTYHLLEACRDYWQLELTAPDRDNRFHHVSTDEVFGSLGPEGRFTESTPYHPNSPYAATKAAGDMLVRAWRHTYGLPIVITNSSNNYGPNQYPEKLIPLTIQCVVARKPIPVYGDGMQLRDWLHVDDHCEALWLVLNRGREGETYCISGRSEWPNLRTVEMICDLVDDLRLDLGGNSRRLITFVADRPGHDRRYAMDSGKVERELGWTPKTRFDAGLRQTVAWYLEHPKSLMRSHTTLK